jgi:hypothetical protein
MATRDSITPEYLRQMLEYDPDTGVLTWLPRTSEMFGEYGGEQSAKWFNENMAGKPAGSGSGGYVRIQINGLTFAAARVAWALYHGEWPVGEIDHINCVKFDNRIANLRVASRAENSRNKCVRSKNKLGVKGVHFDARKKRYVVQLKLLGKTIYRKRFRTIDEAAAAYAAAARQYHGEFARTA